MLDTNLIDAIRLPFRKDKELYRSFYSILGFYPRNITYYQEAMMHRSMSAHGQHGRPINNERLEFLGDAVLDSVVGDIVYRRYQGKREGFLTNTRSKIVQRESLGKIANEIGLDKLIHSNFQTLTHNSYMAGNAFEALVGAVYLDRGYDFCRRFMESRIIDKIVDIDKVAQKEINFKSKLLEWCQKHKAELHFELTGQSTTETGSPVFHSKVSVNGLELGRGKGFSKKESQQLACKNAVYTLKKNKKLRDMVITQVKE